MLGISTLFERYVHSFFIQHPLCYSNINSNSEYYKQYEVGTDLTTKNVIQSQEFRCLDLSDGLNEQSTIQELEHLVSDTTLPTNVSYRTNEVH